MLLACVPRVAGAAWYLRLAAPKGGLAFCREGEGEDKPFVVLHDNLFDINLLYQALAGGAWRPLPNGSDFSMKANHLVLAQRSN